MRGHHFAYRSNQYRLQANRLQAVFSYERRNGSPSILPLRHDKRSLTARGRARGSPRRARSFGDFVFARQEALPCQQNVTSRFDFWYVDNDMILDAAASTRPPFRLSLKSIPLTSKCLQAVFSYERRNGSPGYPPPTGDLFAPLTPLQGAAVKERGHLTAALSSRARSAVSRDRKRYLVNKMRLHVLTFGMWITI